MRNLMSNNVSFATGTVLFTLGSSSDALAQAAPAQPIWGVTCAGTAAGLDCRAVQSLPMTKSGQASVAVHVPADTKKATMLILVQLGIYLPDGVTLQFGDGGTRKVPLHNCDSTGCLAKYSVSDAELSSMRKCVPLSISVKDSNEQPIAVQVPSNGFAAAYAKIK